VRTLHVACSTSLLRASAQSCVLETLRLLPPIWNTTRQAVADTYLGEHFIPKVRELLGAKAPLPSCARS
jgi:cytochrome P450